MKQRIRLTEGQLNRVIRESVRRIIKESLDTPPYYWSISRCNGEWEHIDCIEDSATSHDASADKFSTPDEAYADGLKNLKFYNDDRYVLEVYYFCPNGAGEYVSDYMAENEYGKIHEY